MQLNTSIQLTYAHLQLAAEAIYPTTFTEGTINPTWLIEGNNRSSRFTTAQAEQFVREWRVVSHQANTDTGFSGTLFEYIGPDDPSRGLVRGQRVVSFRSTEFADDAARDNQATNVLEVKAFGWAFGQIADMKRWVDGLYATGALSAAAPLGTRRQLRRTHSVALGRTSQRKRTARETRERVEEARSCLA